jgi:hypothetical protein
MATRCTACRSTGVVAAAEFHPFTGPREAGWVCGVCEDSAWRNAERIRRVGAALWFTGFFSAAAGVLFVFAVGLLTVVRFLLTGQ